MKSRESFVKEEIKIIKKYWIILLNIFHILLHWMMKKD